LEADEGDPVTDVPERVPRLRIFNKVDLLPQAAARRSGMVFWLSARTGAGIELLEQALVELAGGRSAEGSAFLARERHLLALEAAARELAEADAVETRWELFAENLRLAQQQLGGITGEVTADDLLGEIFSRFCIGK
jgi:tRNA modification GTPase